jgi:hypothetical protein
VREMHTLDPIGIGGKGAQRVLLVLQTNVWYKEGSVNQRIYHA